MDACASCGTDSSGTGPEAVSTMLDVTRATALATLPLPVRALVGT